MVISEARKPAYSLEENQSDLIPWYVVGAVALICAAALILISVLGPLVLNTIHYRTTQSGIWQTEGQDLTDLILVTPILVIGGILHLLRRDSSKYFLVLPPITLIYTGLSYGIGQEWSDTSLSGNVQDFFWLYLTLIIGGLVLLIGSLSLFSESDAPHFRMKSLRIYVGLMSFFLLVFGAMWVSQVSQVINTGDLSDGSYISAPTVFWTIRYLDLGFTIPLGFLALFLLWSKPRRAYPLVLLFFGFFITMGTAVNAMGSIMVVKGGSSISSFAIFPILGILAYAGFFYLVKDKLPWNRHPALQP